MEASLVDMVAALAGWVPTALAWLGTLVVLGLGVVAITPSKKDDEYVGKIYGVPFLGGVLKAIAAFSPLQKKEKK